MKLKPLFYTLIFLSFYFNDAQNEAAIWYFGANAGLDFNSGTPVALTDGQLNTDEGCATISNSSGQLLFYTDGITVWDKNHLEMPNGTGLQGDPSSSQSGIIVPNPSDVNQYYIFSVDNDFDDGGLFYSIIDLTLNSNNGDVISGQKNINLLPKSAEKIAAIEDDQDGYWVLSYAGFNGTESTYNTFHAFRINTLGISSSIKSTFNSCGTDEGRGYLKISADASKVMICNQTQTHVCLYGFDFSTGIVSNEIQLQTNGSPYCAEFSASSEKVYVSTGNFEVGATSLYQFDLLNPNIQNSRTLIYSESSQRAALQLAIDGKIYYARPNQTFLGVINDPEALGLSCNYINQGVDLNGKFSTQGLPPFIQSFFAVGINTEDTCFGDSTQFSVNSNEVIDSIFWDFGDGNTSIQENPIHNYISVGVYTVSVVVNSGTETRNLSKEVTISEIPIANTMSNYVLCDDNTNNGAEVFNLTTKDPQILGMQSATQFNVRYYPTQLDAEDNTNALPLNYSNTSNNQEVFAKIFNVDNASCYAVTSFNLIVSQYPIANTVADVILCDDVSQDGVATIDLTVLNNDVLNGQIASSFNISYHLTQGDANNSIAALPDDFQTSGQIVFVRLENSININCFDTTSFTITIDDYFAPNQPENMFLCDDVNNDGVEAFNLVSQNDEILFGLPGTYNVSYHVSQEDADNNVNTIVGSFENSSNSQEVFARIEKTANAFCYQTLSFFIEVKETPIINMETEWFICSNETITIIAESGFDEYLWSTGETTQSIVVSSAGIYTVTVFYNYATVPVISCSSLETITVTESDEAVFNRIENVDWTVSENEIRVFVEGLGDYEYSLDGILYQDSNLFSGLNPGEYTVYVRDKLGCGVIAEEVYLLFYPYFFTPNNDTYNDFWQIKFSENEPDLEIFIFDRYGKLLTTLNPRSRGWDGTYNGNLMPASDYWFLVKRPSNGKEYKGHFTLRH